MKELRLDKYDLMDVPVEPTLGELYLRAKLSDEGFDLDKEIGFYEDKLTGELVYTQKED